MKNTLDDLRKMAVELLERQGGDVALNSWGNSVRDLLQELSVYRIELEHQNAALEQSEKNLAETQAEYVKLFENAPVGYVVIDSEGIILKVNKTFMNLFIPVRAREDVVLGRTFNEFVCPEFQSTFKVFRDMIRKPGISVPVELKLLDRFGNPHYVLVTAGERHENEHKFQLTISDIAMQKKLEASLVREKEKAEESDRRKSHFLTGVSHELRTPLATMIGFSEILDDPRLDRTERSECVGSIQSAGKLLINLADEILDLSVLESGIAPLRASDTDLVEICSETVTLAQRRIAGKNVLLRSELENIPILFVDQMRLRQMLDVILEHAAGNATEGSIIIRGKYEPSDQQNGILTLIFTGTNIFSGESSLDPDIRRKPVSQNCAGLGLYLAKQIINAMNGQMIWLHPLDTLRVEIPLQVSPNGKRRKETSEKNEEKTIERPWRCLVVDDVVMNLKVLEGMLKRLKCETSSASSGKDALELLAHNSFDLVLTDLWMPEMSGEELVVQIRQNPKYDDIPIVAVTADVEREKNFDMDFFAQTMIKPVNLDKLKKLFIRLNAEKNPEYQKIELAKEQKKDNIVFDKTRRD